MSASGPALDASVIRLFLQRLAERLQQPTTLYLLGGSALCLLGHPRVTVDVDYVGSDLPDPSDRLQAAIRTVAHEMHIEVEGVPLDKFIPLPAGYQQRHRLLQQWGNLRVYLFDPYSLALSKIDRGFESDYEDVLFLIRQGLVRLDELERYVNEVAEHGAREYAIDRAELLTHLQAVRKLLRRP